MSLTRRDRVVALATACAVLALGSVARTASPVLTSSVFDQDAWHPAGPGSVISATYHVLAWRSPGMEPERVSKGN